MSTFTFFWKNGVCELSDGENVNDAMYKAGYGQIYFNAMSFFEVGDKMDDFYWSAQDKGWIAGTDPNPPQPKIFVNQAQA